MIFLQLVDQMSEESNSSYEDLESVDEEGTKNLVLQRYPCNVEKIEILVFSPDQSSLPGVPQIRSFKSVAK